MSTARRTWGMTSAMRQRMASSTIPLFLLRMMLIYAVLVTDFSNTALAASTKLWGSAHSRKNRPWQNSS